MLHMALPAPAVIDIVRAVYTQPGRRHAMVVDSEQTVESLRLALDHAVEQLHGKDAVWGRGIRIKVERDDSGQPHRVWIWRSLVGGQRTVRDGFSSRARRVRA